MPWSSVPETNFIESAVTYRQLLGAAGFKVEKERSRRDFAAEFFRQLRQRMAEAQAKGDPQPPSLPILMGVTTPQKLANMTALLDRGVIAPTEMISRAI